MIRIIPVVVIALHTVIEPYQYDMMGMIQLQVNLLITVKSICSLRSQIPNSKV